MNRSVVGSGPTRMPGKSRPTRDLTAAGKVGVNKRGQEGVGAEVSRTHPRKA